MKRDSTGKYVKSTLSGESIKAFVPDPLPPDPNIVLDRRMLRMLEAASLDLGRLDSLSTLLPGTDIFLYMYIRKEAVVSSQIEGTQSSLSQLLLFEIDEAPGVPIDDVQEVSNYVAAMEHGLNRIRTGFPISLRLMREIHKVLLGTAGSGDSDKTPGEFRKSQNWIGGTRPGNAVFVPPPPDHLISCLDAFEKFIHDDSYNYPILIKVALCHVQFETIHPFLDGNGRLGRLLITLLLCAQGVLQEPLLYLSLFFKMNRQQYYDMLNNIRLTGDWEEWIRFFIDGVQITSKQAVSTARDLTNLFNSDKKKIQDIGRSAGSTLRVHQHLSAKPLAQISDIAESTNLTLPTVASALERLQEMQIVKELTGYKRNRLFAYKKYLEILERGTEPL